MLGIDCSNKYRKALIELINSINYEIGLSEKNQVLIVVKLNTEEKIINFNEWVKTKIINNKFHSTEAEIMHFVGIIGKE